MGEISANRNILDILKVKCLFWKQFRSAGVSTPYIFLYMPGLLTATAQNLECPLLQLQ